MPDFVGKTALVTGAAQGIGRAIAEALKARGATVIATDIDADGLARTARALGVAAETVDLGDRTAVQDAISAILAQVGRIDIAINAAGGTRGQVGRPLEEIRPDDWQAIFAANTDSAVWLAQALAPGMRKNGYGRFVAIASGAGLRPSLTGIQAYTAAKHALVGLVRQLAQELGPDGITVNAVAPGFVRSNPTSERQWQAMGPEGQRKLIESTHLRRLGTAADIANAALFLASDEAAWITGQILSVDGGRA